VALATPSQPSGLNRETTLQVLGQLQSVTVERDPLATEFAECIARHPSNRKENRSR
jgi:hypothetical protein